jgi:biopolymer transport protein ExbB
MQRILGLHRHASKTLLFLIMLVALVVPSAANAWWNGDWAYRKKITIDPGTAGAALTQDAGRVPILLRLHDGNFRFSDAKDDGSDLRLVDIDDATPLKFHIDTYDGLLGIALVWVDVPLLRAGAPTEFYLYYGNTNAPVGGDPRGTYDADTTLVYHFGEAAAPPRDQTAYNNAGEPAVTSVDAAIIGRGARFNGTNTITLPGSPSLAIGAGAAFSWSAWVKSDAPQANAVLFAKRDGPNALVIGLDQDVPYVAVTTGGATSRTPAVPAITPAAWHHVAVTASDGITLYVDGRPATTLAVPLPSVSGAASLGAPGAGVPIGAGFVGEMDELQLAKVARTQAFITAAFASQGPDGQMLAYGADEENSTWSTGYFGVILRSVTIDGWVVIGILMVMAAISFIVMLVKGIYISRVARANANFLDRFDEAGSDVQRFAGLAASDPGDLDRSVLYHLFEAGHEELQRRSAANSVGRLALSPQAVATLRASLDRISAYESQRLNSMMVLLTIAISGGPFLGLLGTVVGVMITFAAIAATGDVNINAIAPGIAAALVATVAGLAVAIPALFGYNYLITRIKDLTTEMHCFVDEFVTRIAEAYPPTTFEPHRLAAE